MAKLMKRDEIPEEEMDIHYEDDFVVDKPQENSDIDELDSIADEGLTVTAAERVAQDDLAIDVEIDVDIDSELDSEINEPVEDNTESSLEDDISAEESSALIQEAKLTQAKKEMETQRRLAQRQQERESSRVALEMLGSAMNGVSSLLRGSAKATSDIAGSLLESRALSKLREINHQEAFRGIKSLEDMTPHFKSNLFKDITQEFGDDPGNMTNPQKAIIDDLMVSYQSKNSGFNGLMSDAVRTMKHSEKRLDYFTKNLDSSDESKEKLELYIARLEKIKEQVPGWLKVGDTNVSEFLSRLLDKAQKFFDSKFGSSPGMSN